MELEQELQNLRDLQIANRNGLISLMDLIARQPQMDCYALKANLVQMLGTEFAEFHPQTKLLLENFLEITERCNPGM